jgi:hypothetical protein
VGVALAVLAGATPGYDLVFLLAAGLAVALAVGGALLPRAAHSVR